nr:replication initiator protein A [Sulfitobacter sp. DFL-23]
MAALNEEWEVGPTIRFRAYDLLKATNRGTDGCRYEQLRAALERLQSTMITTNLITGGTEMFDGFGLIDLFRIVREARDGRMQEVEIRLSDWVFNAIRHREVLTLHRDYFRYANHWSGVSMNLLERIAGQRKNGRLDWQSHKPSAAPVPQKRSFAVWL